MISHEEIFSELESLIRPQLPPHTYYQQKPQSWRAAWSDADGVWSVHYRGHIDNKTLELDLHEVKVTLRPVTKLCVQLAADFLRVALAEHDA